MQQDRAPGIQRRTELRAQAGINAVFDKCIAELECSAAPGLGMAHHIACQHGAKCLQCDRRRADIAAQRKAIRRVRLSGIGQLILDVDVGFAAPRNKHQMVGHHQLQRLAQHIDRQF